MSNPIRTLASDFHEQRRTRAAWQFECHMPSSVLILAGEARVRYLSVSSQVPLEQKD